MKKENIILIGFMGVGKGTVSRKLVEMTNSFALDTDDLIESMENKKIKSIFELHGELYFRKLEKKTALWLEKNVNNTIISTGGGFYKQENLKNIGKVIYLESSFEGVINRILNSENAQKKIKKRPLLNNLDEAKEIFKNRIEEYEKIADLIVSVENKSLDDIAQEIIGLV